MYYVWFVFIGCWRQFIWLFWIWSKAKIDNFFYFNLGNVFLWFIRSYKCTIKYARQYITQNVQPDIFNQCLNNVVAMLLLLNFNNFCFLKELEEKPVQILLFLWPNWIHNLYSMFEILGHYLFCLLV